MCRWALRPAVMMCSMDMSVAEAETLAVLVRSFTDDEVNVVADDEDVVVEVRTEHGTFTMWHEDDWEWLKPRILGTT